MKLHVARWGNSLALRLPAELVRQMGLKDGDSVQASLGADGNLHLRTGKWDRAAFSAELAELRAQMPLGEPVIDELRRGGRY